MTVALARALSTASRTVLYTGTSSRPSTVAPALPGVTPATTWVPYSFICRAWKPPAEPVMPWTSRRVSLPTSTLMNAAPFVPGWRRALDGRARRQPTSPGGRASARRPPRRRSLGQLHDLLGAVGHVGRRHHVEPAVGEDLLAQV